MDDQYVGKVFSQPASVNSTSIEIKNTTFEDEACYICSFKVYPFQPKRQTLCLAVKGRLNTCYNHESHKAFLSDFESKTQGSANKADFSDHQDWDISI